MRQPTILVLWSYRSDEVTTVLLVSRLRDAGLRVKLIGLDGRSCAGRVGLVLKADRTLAEWLASTGVDQCKQNQQLSGVILPFDHAALQRFAHDERFLQLLHLAQYEDALIVIHEDQQPLFAELFMGDAAHIPLGNVRMLPAPDEWHDFLYTFTQAFS